MSPHFFYIFFAERVGVCGIFDIFVTWISDEIDSQKFIFYIQLK
ncbi:hypothetical protein HMPREF0650_0945 [Hoylesella buccalis ATCC 35310]|uniref:Uncharacterized protein n=1 Tax=Hoylesella buccalis ATCC 35310 TaxID=679190 RepID=D1W972_9BACT|nr:hypothetical protein HMPREF0650_0945 [Hoylesella buccalis ATCC 35310]